MKKVLIYSFIAFVAMVGVSGCENMVETTPKQSVDAKDALNSLDDVNAALMGTYDVLQWSSYYGRDFIIVSELLGDNMKIHTKNSNRFTSEQNNMPGYHVGIWGADYTIINRVNNILANVDRFTDPNDPIFENKKAKI